MSVPATETVWIGAHTVETDPEGWTGFWRLDPAARLTVPEEEFWQRVRAPAGVHATWQAHASGLELELRGSDDMRPVDVLVDDELVERLPVTPAARQHRVELPDRPVRVQLWLPQFGQIALRGPRFTGGEATPSPRVEPRWITYGSSITQCRSADGPSQTWPGLVARANGWELTCLGFGGQCHLDPVVARTIRDMPADLISACLGINIYGRASFASRTLHAQVAGFLQTIRDGHPTTPLVVITPIRSPAREDAPNAVGMTLGDVRDQVAAAVHALIDLGDTNLHLIDGLTLMSTDEAHELLPDGLHPSTAGYALLAHRLAPRLHASLDTESTSWRSVGSITHIL